jgi:hypothetical protein
MANHQVPRTAECIETLEAPDADGATVRCRVYRHTRAGHAQPMFYVVHYRLTPAGRIDRSTRVTNQISGARAQYRLDTELAAVRAMFARARADAARREESPR